MGIQYMYRYRIDGWRENQTERQKNRKNHRIRKCTENNERRMTKCEIEGGERRSHPLHEDTGFFVFELHFGFAFAFS